MKTLLFNGCSFMAGDEIAWEKYCLETKGYALKWKDFISPLKLSQEDFNFFLEYQNNYRRLNNLPMAVATHLNCGRIDISENGNSNDNIAISTISYLLSKSVEERKQFHVCIGWTSVCRFIKYLEEMPNVNAPYFANLHVNHAGLSNIQPELKNIQSYIDISFQTLTDEDFWLNYVRNIILLENFLKINGITYTFYRALGSTRDVKVLGPLQPYNFILPNDQITNDTNWYKFDTDSGYTFEKNSWTDTTLLNMNYWVSYENRHPNLKAVELFSKELANFIQNQNVLD